MGAPARSDPSRAVLLSRLADARSRSDELFGIVRPEALYDRPIPERHRIIFYVGHLEAFDWNLLRAHLPGCTVFDERFDKLFAFGIDPVDGGLPNEPASQWPAREAVADYCRRVRETLDAGIARASFSDPERPLLRDGYLLHVAIEHRLMHAETLAYMFHQLPLEGKIAPPQTPDVSAPAVAPRTVEIPAGMAKLGQPRGVRGAFGWDNEFDEFSVAVPGFAIDQYKVTNRQFLEFVVDRGYQREELWSPENWAWVQTSGIRHPTFWVERDGAWMYRGMFRELPLPLDWPVYVSHAEASACARWAGKRLPTEAEFHRAAYSTRDTSERAFPWGESVPGPQHGNFDFAGWDPTPVNAHPAGDSAFGVAGMLGNGWEWTSTVFGPFAGFQRFPFYPGYSADFFDGQHYVMKGGSARTAACMLRRSFRNWFQPRYPYTYTGFRCVED